MPYKIARSFLILLLAVSAACLLLTVPASALEISPYELEFKVGPGQEQTRNITIFNNSEEETGYCIYTDEEYSEWFTFTPGEVILGPQQRREVTVNLRPPLTSTGKHDAFIYIAPQPQRSGTPVALGMKLRASIDISVTGLSTGNMLDSTWLIIVIAAGAVTLLVLFFAVIRPLAGRR